MRSAGAGQAQEARAAPMTSPPDSHRPVARQPKRAFREPDRQDHEHVHEQHRIPVSFRGIAPSSVVEAVWHGPSPESGKVVPLPRPPARRPTAGRPCARRDGVLPEPRPGPANRVCGLPMAPWHSFGTDTRQCSCDVRGFSRRCSTIFQGLRPRPLHVPEAICRSRRVRSMPTP